MSFRDGWNGFFTGWDLPDAEEIGWFAALFAVAIGITAVVMGALTLVAWVLS